MTSVKTGLRLGLLLCVAFALRAASASYGLPALYHQDEPMMVNHALAMAAAHSLHPHYFVIPAFVMEALLVLYALFFAAGKIFGMFHGPRDFALHFLTDPTPFYFMGRLFIGAAFGTGAVAMVWQAARKFFSEEIAWLAAVFLTVAFLHVKNSYFIYADPPMTFFTLCFFYAVWRLYDSKTMGWALYSGIFLGLAMATKYNAVFAAIPALLVYFIFVKGKIGPVLAAVAAACLVFFALDPYVLLDWSGFLSTWQSQIRSQTFWGWGYHFKYSLANGLGWPLLSLSLLGFAVWVKRFQREGFCALGFVVVHYLTCVFLGQPYDRYAVPMVPFLCLSAAFAFSALFPRRGVIRLLALVAVIVIPISASEYSGTLLRRADTRTQCKDWFEKNVEAGTGVALDHPFFSPRLTPTDDQTRMKAQQAEPDASQRLRWELETEANAGKKKFHVFYLTRDAAEHPRFSSAQPALPLDVASLKRQGVQYVVANYQDANNEVRAFREELLKNGEIAAVFSPYQDKNKKWSKDWAALTADPVLLEELFSRDAPGPYLEVYRLHG